MSEGEKKAPQFSAGDAARPFAAFSRKTARRWFTFAACFVGGLGVALIGYGLSETSHGAGQIEKTMPRFGWISVPVAESLARLSFDLPHLVRGKVSTPEICIVYVDENAARALEQRSEVFDRRLHARLLRRLKDEGARAVLFDYVFASASDPQADDDFAKAMQEHGTVFLGAAMEFVEDDASPVVQNRVIPPVGQLRKASAGWGHLAFRPVDPDYGVRRMYLGHDRTAAATWRAAVKLGAPLTDTGESRAEQRWLHYVGRAETIPNIAYDRVLDAESTPDGFLKDRIVLVGGRSTLSGLNAGKDTFAGPFTRINGKFHTGVEVHATVLLNLLRGDWLVRLDARRESLIVLIFGLMLGGLLPAIRPHLALLFTLAGIAAVLFGVYVLLDRQRTWFAWSIPVLIQAPVALGWAVGARYFIEERRRLRIRNAMSRYLSPELADRIADGPEFSLEPGGKETEATVMFTDLEGFTKMSETMPPSRLSEILIDYFTRTTEDVLENRGTIIKYIGDAVLAVWNAPVADPQHAKRAAIAAFRVHSASQITIDVNGRAVPLNTRIGIHTGRVLAGNLGSKRRIDYTVIGDTVNTASRLEGLDKYLGTNILVSDATAGMLDGEIRARRVGQFVFMGKTDALLIYELVEAPPEQPVPWMEQFEHGLDAFASGDVETARRCFDSVLAERPNDGPTLFYLERLTAGDLRWPVELEGK